MVILSIFKRENLNRKIPPQHFVCEGIYWYYRYHGIIGISWQMASR